MAEIFEYKNMKIGYYKCYNGKSETKQVGPDGQPVMREWVIQIFSVLIGNMRNGDGKWAPCFYSGRTLIDPKKPISFKFKHDISLFKNRTTGKTEYKFQLNVTEFSQEEKPFKTEIVSVPTEEPVNEEQSVEKALEGII